MRMYITQRIYITQSRKDAKILLSRSGAEFAERNSFCISSLRSQRPCENKNLSSPLCVLAALRDTYIFWFLTLRDTHFTKG